jgi:hypothetical protein
MIRCEMAGCADMADVVAKCKDLVHGTIEYDFCKSCADYLSEELELIRITPYANKGLTLKNIERVTK